MSFERIWIYLLQLNNFQALSVYEVTRLVFCVAALTAFTRVIEARCFFVLFRYNGSHSVYIVNICLK